MRLVILADDFTGAVDTAVQFAQRGIATGYYSDAEDMEKSLQKREKEVFVMNAETRHLPGEEAYRRVYELCRRAVRGGAEDILKKTDSGLRGNIGRELEAVLDAVLDAAENPRLHFIPSYPRMNRITRRGIHYIDGLPVAESVFGRDPFEPAEQSEIRELFKDTRKSLWSCTADTDPEECGDGNGIFIWDSETEQEIKRIVETAVKSERGKDDRVRLWAGCAGLAQILAETLPFRRGKYGAPERRSRLVVVCGSVNGVSEGQAKWASRHGFAEFSIDSEILLGTDAVWERKRGEISREVLRECRKGRSCLVDTGFPDAETIGKYSRQHGRTSVELGEMVAVKLGQLAGELYEDISEADLMIVGGDTLQAFIRGQNAEEISLLGENPPGVVVLGLKKSAGVKTLYTKSGGFGGESLFGAWMPDCAAKKTEGKKKEKVVL